MAFKQDVASIDADEAYQILNNFNPNTDRYSEEINMPKLGDVYIHYSTDKNKYGK